MAEDAARIRIENITPTPPEDVLVAIGLALEEGWPHPQPPRRAITANELQWRLGQRPWMPRRRPSF